MIQDFRADEKIDRQASSDLNQAIQADEAAADALANSVVVGTEDQPMVEDD